MSSLHSGLPVSTDFGGSLPRAFNTVKSVPNLAAVRKQPTRSGAVSKKRLGTPIKKQGTLKASIIDDDEDDELIKNLTREIEEIRA